MLWDVFQGCDQYLALVDWTWTGAQAAAGHAARAVLATDLLDPSTRDRMHGTWAACSLGGQA